MDKINRPKKVNKSEQNVQNNEFIQKNMQSQLNNIYDYLDKVQKELEGTELYYGSVTSGGTVTLSDNKDNYDRIEFFGSSGASFGRLYVKTGSQAVRLTSILNNGSNRFTIYALDGTINGNTFTTNNNSSKILTTSISNSTSGMTTVRIVGYKY